MKIFPLSLVIEGRVVPVVGTSHLAAAKMRAVARAGGHAIAIDPDLTMPQLDNLAGIALIVDDDSARAALWKLRLRTLGLLVNVADMPELSDFQLPAVVDRAPVVVAIATGGASATLARRLREHVEAQLPSHLGALADALAAARPLVAGHLKTPQARRIFWDRMLAPGGPMDPFGLDAPPSSDAIIAQVDAAECRPGLAIITLASPDADDLSLRALRRLQAADVVVTEGDWAESLSSRARRDARLVCYPRLPPDWAEALMPDARRAVLLLSSASAVSLPHGWDIEHISCGQAGL